MKKEKVKLGSLTLIGMTARTNNKNEMNPKTSKIGKLASTYWDNKLPISLKIVLTPWCYLRCLH